MIRCVACFDNGRCQPARWHLPQSHDLGKTVTFTVGCDEHKDWWWDGADWDGRSLVLAILVVTAKFA